LYSHCTKKNYLANKFSLVASKNFSPSKKEREGGRERRRRRRRRFY